MKTKELIRQLQENDPSGENEVNIDGVDIWYVDSLPGYYDGPYQVLDRDETCQYYNIIGAKYKKSGRKVIIKTLSILEALENGKKGKMS